MCERSSSIKIITTHTNTHMRGYILQCSLTALLVLETLQCSSPHQPQLKGVSKRFGKINVQSIKESKLCDQIIWNILEIHNLIQYHSHVHDIMWEDTIAPGVLTHGQDAHINPVFLIINGLKKLRGGL